MPRSVALLAVAIVAIGCLIGAGALLVDVLITTEAERIEAVLEAMRRAVVARDVDRFLSHFSSPLRARPRTEELERRARRQLEGSSRVEVRIQSKEIRVKGSQASAILGVKVKLESPDGLGVYSGWTHFSVEAGLTKDAEIWKVNGFELYHLLLGGQRRKVF